MPSNPIADMTRNDRLVYLALGDSYTIGTGTSSRAANFPSLLALRLEQAVGRRVKVANPAVDGYTTQDLIRDELPLLPRIRPDFVSVLIGTNDIVQGISANSYEAALERIFDAILHHGVDADRVLVISIPDWSATPKASKYGRPQTILRRIEHFNDTAKREAALRAFRYTDIVAISRRREPNWLASDWLHPSDAQYLAWAEHLWISVEDAWTCRR